MPVRAYGPVATSGGSAWSNNGPVQIPADAVAGDTLWLLCSISGSGSVPAFPPAGWSVYQRYLASGGSSSHGAIVYTRTAQAGDAGALVPVTFGSSIPWAMVIVATTGTASAIDAPRTVVSDANAATAITLPSFTRAADATVIDLVALRYNTGSLGSAAAGGAVTEKVDGASQWTSPRRGVWVGERSATANTATPAATVTPDSAIRHSTVTIAFVSAVAPVEPPAPVTTGQVVAATVSDFGPTHLRGGWIVPAGASVRMVASTSPDLSAPTYSAAVTASSAGWVTAKVTGLAADMLHHVGIEIGGVLQTDARTRARTLPTPGTEASFTVLAGSCQVTGSNHASLARAAGEDAKYLIHMGDLHYADATDGPGWQAGVTASLRTQNMRALTAAMPMTYLWDNHDSPDGNSSNAASTGWPAVAAAYRQLTGDLPHATAGYRTWAHGRVRFIRTDMWSQKSAQSATDNATKTLLGATQKQWLKDTLAAATEPLIVWVTGWPTTATSSRWGSYVTETAELQAWFAEHPDVLARTVMVGGDSHDIRATSGTRAASAGGGTAFPGMASLNASPFDQSGATSNKDGWDIGQADVASGRGVYSRLDFDDAGTDGLALTWTAVRDDGAEVMTYSRAYGAAPSTATGEGSTAYAGSAAGGRPSSAAGAGEVTRVGMAVGARSASGSATGLATRTGSSVGTSTRLATAGGSTARNGAATSAINPVGTAAGDTVWIGASVGAAPTVGARYGSAVGETVHVGAAAGARTPKASTAGTVAYVGAATGTAPSLTGASAAAAGATARTSTAAGITRPLATTTGSTARIGAATGARRPTATTTGQTVYLGACAGMTPGVGRDLEITVGTPTGHPLRANEVTGHSLTAGAARSNP